MARYGIATLFEVCADGHEFTEVNTPLHLTHVDAFDVNFEPDIFIGVLRQYLRSQPPFFIMPISNTFFGPNKDIPVTIISINNELKAFHESLVHFLEFNKATFDNLQFLKEGYAPHVSIYGPRRVDLNKSLLIKNVSVGHKRPDVDNPPNRIISTIPLG